MLKINEIRKIRDPTVNNHTLKSIDNNVPKIRLHILLFSFTLPVIRTYERLTRAEELSRQGQLFHMCLQILKITHRMKLLGHMASTTLRLLNSMVLF